MAFDVNGVLHVANMGADEILALPDRDGNGVQEQATGLRTGGDGNVQVHVRHEVENQYQAMLPEPIPRDDALFRIRPDIRRIPVKSVGHMPQRDGIVSERDGRLHLQR